MDTEGCLRRNNVPIIGLPERVKGIKPIEFTEQLLITVLKLRDMAPTFVVERAQRILLTAPKRGEPPRPFFLRLLNYRDRDLILTAVRVESGLQYENTKLPFFPDYPPKVQQQGRTFTEVQKRLRDNEIKFSLLYPSKLQVIDGDCTRFFVTSEAASEWLDTR